MRRALILGALGALLLAGCSSGASDEDIEELRSELGEVRTELERLSGAIDALEVDPPSATPTSPASTPTPRPTAAPTVEATPEPLACALSIDSFRTARRSGSFQEFVDLTFVVRNNEDRQVKAWQMSVAFYDPFGDLLFAGRFRSGDAAVPAGDVQDASFSYDDNQFIDDEPYDYLATFAVENLEIEVVECEVSFVDG